MLVQGCAATIAWHASSRLRSSDGDIMQSVIFTSRALSANAASCSAGISIEATTISQSFICCGSQSILNVEYLQCSIRFCNCIARRFATFIFSNASYNSLRSVFSSERIKTSLTMAYTNGEWTPWPRKYRALFKFDGSVLRPYSRLLIFLPVIFITF